MTAKPMSWPKWSVEALRGTKQNATRAVNVASQLDNSAADMTAIAMPIRLLATGTDPSCMSFVRESDARRVRNLATPCEANDPKTDTQQTQLQSFDPAKDDESETPCNDLQDVAGSASTRTRTLDPGIKSPLLYQLSYRGWRGARV